MANEHKDDVPPGDWETTAAAAVPAIYANRFHITVAGPTVRIAFAEGIHGKDTTYRAAVLTTLDDARALAGLLTDLIAKALLTQSGQQGAGTGSEQEAKSVG